ncbi:MAG: hypothetical protein IJU56_06735, partial [Clostridia bacterium]|nr:hypothetical protein [Clostridia bacterium]
LLIFGCVILVMVIESLLVSCGCGKLILTKLNHFFYTLLSHINCKPTGDLKTGGTKGLTNSTKTGIMKVQESYLIDG